MNFADLCRVNSQEALEVAHMFFLQFNRINECENYLAMMKEQGVSVSSHYQSLHSSKFGKSFSRCISDMRNSDSVSKTLLRIPLWCGISENDVSKIVSTNNKVISKIAKGNEN